MPQLVIELSEDKYQRLLAQAVLAEQTPEEWALAQLRPHLLSRAEIQASVDRLLERIPPGQEAPATPNGSHNERIDEDLAREYADPHQDAH
jgi:hypothetical protein